MLEARFGLRTADAANPSIFPAPVQLVLQAAGKIIAMLAGVGGDCDSRESRAGCTSWPGGRSAIAAGGI
jgi:hypothetical protein